MRPTEERPRGVQSVDRALDILEVLAAHPGTLGVTEVAREVGLAQGTAHRLLAALVGAGTGGLLAAVLLPIAVPTQVRPGGTDELARQIFSTWVWPFELLSLLLLAALVGAFAVAGLTTDRERR